MGTGPLHQVRVYLRIRIPDGLTGQGYLQHSRRFWGLNVPVTDNRFMASSFSMSMTSPASTVCYVCPLLAIPQCFRSHLPETVTYIIAAVCAVQEFVRMNTLSSLSVLLTSFIFFLSW